jgi:hypothetical protein
MLLPQNSGQIKFIIIIIINFLLWKILSIENSEVEWDMINICYVL